MHVQVLGCEPTGKTLKTTGGERTGVTPALDPPPRDVVETVERIRLHLTVKISSKNIFRKRRRYRHDGVPSEARKRVR